MSNFRNLRVMFAAVASLPLAVARAERLVTHSFEGVVIESTSSLVSVGHRLTGTFTYDRDWEDLIPEDPESFTAWFPPGYAAEPFPIGSPIGMSYTVGFLSHHTSELAELIIYDNESSLGDYFYFGSDALFGPSALTLGGAFELKNPDKTAFISDRPPAVLNLPAFSASPFWGFDGQGGGFTATLQSLHVVPEPATLKLLCAVSLLYVGFRMRNPEVQVGQLVLERRDLQ